MESTGVYWKPLYNILESDFEIILVNARHIKNVPGRKTDKKDSKLTAKQGEDVSVVITVSKKDIKKHFS